MFVAILLLRAFPVDMLKVKINSNLTHKSKKGLSMDELQARQNEFLLQNIYALYCSFAILFFYYFSANLSPLSLSPFSSYIIFF
jgi:hypothetical protein